MALHIIRHLNSTVYRNGLFHLNRRVLPVVQEVGSSYNILGNRNYNSVDGSSSSSSDNSSNNYNQSQKQQRTMMTSTHVSSKYVFDPPTITSLPVVTGSNNNDDNDKDNEQLHFPVRRVYCVGKNYAEHVKEMGGDVRRSKPIFFTKPVDGVVFAGTGGHNNNNNNNNSTPIKYPPNTSNFHYEVELVVAIGKEIRYSDITNSSGNNTSINDAAAAAAILDCVYGYAVGIDLTRRDLQQDAKDNRGPWTLGKYFDESAPIGPISPSSSSSSLSFEEHIDDKIMSLTVNGEVKQSVQLNEMIWNVPEIIAELLKSYDLKPGDLIMTGTPSGVGPVTVGDRIIGSIDGGMVKNVDITLV